MQQVIKQVGGSLLIFFLFSGNVLADWVLDNDKSGLYFASIKKGDVAEVHSFKKLSGVITKAGEGALNIDLASLSTGVEIRDTRMRDLLFETGKFAMAKVSVDLSKTGVKPGIQQVTVQLDLHGIKKQVVATVDVEEVGGAVLVATVAPIILNAADFDLAGGLTTLREIGSVESISNAVPVTFFLRFDKQS